MDNAASIPFLTIGQLAPLIRRKQVSPVEVVDAFLRRINEIDVRTNAFINVMYDEALEAARIAEDRIVQGEYLGPLHGVTIGLKDLFYTKGVPTTAGSKISKWAGFVPQEDATVVARLRKAGGIILGKLNMHEFAAGSTNYNPHYGPTRNPWRLDRITGGSSGGSGVAVATSLCSAALGTDTGGSVRIPSCLCGVVGLKPTYGRLSRFGIIPLAWSLDHAGPMTKTVEDAALLMNAMAGYDPRDPSTQDVEVPDYTSQLGESLTGLRLGIPREFFSKSVNPEVRQSVERAMGVLEELGASLSELSLPTVTDVPRFHHVISMSEAASYHKETLRRHGDELSLNVRQRFETGSLMPATQYIRAQRARASLSLEVSHALQQVDALVMPTAPVTAPLIGQDVVTTGRGEEATLALMSRNTAPFNDTGLPACTVPCGFDSTGLPIGLQIAGRPFQEATVLSIAHAYEHASDWHNRRPLL